MESQQGPRTPNLPSGGANQDHTNREVSRTENERYWKGFRIAAIVAIIEVASVVIWVASEDQPETAARVLRWLACCGFVAGGAVIAHKLVGKKFRIAQIVFIWLAWLSVSAFLYVKNIRESTKAFTQLMGQQDWVPPELPNGCSNITMRCGDLVLSYSVDYLKRYPFGPNPENVAFQDLPLETREQILVSPGYTKRLKTLSAKSFCPLPINPLILSNRLYVFVTIPFLEQRRKILIGDEMDSILTNCLPQSWDWNYNKASNAFEIVNESNRPIVQVSYKSPSEIDVRGLFQDSGFLWIFYNGNPVRIPLGPNPDILNGGSLKVFTGNGEQQVSFETFKNKFSNTDLYLWDGNTTNLYSTYAAGQKTKFKYPANVYLGIFAK